MKDLNGEGSERRRQGSRRAWYTVWVVYLQTNIEVGLSVASVACGLDGRSNQEVKVEQGGGAELWIH